MFAIKEKIFPSYFQDEMHFALIVAPPPKYRNQLFFFAVRLRINSAIYLKLLSSKNQLSWWRYNHREMPLVLKIVWEHIFPRGEHFQIMSVVYPEILSLANDPREKFRFL